MCGSLPPSSCCFCLATVRYFAGTPVALLFAAALASSLPSRATHRQVSTTVPPRRCRHPGFYSSLTSSLGSDSTIFSRPSTLSRQRAVVVPGISSSPCCRSMRPPSGRPARRAAAVSTPLPGPPPLAYSFAPPRRDELPCLASSGRANHLYAAWPCNLFLSSPPSLHLRTVAGALAK